MSANLAQALSPQRRPASAAIPAGWERRTVPNTIDPLQTQPKLHAKAILPPMPAEVRVGLVGFGENERLAITTILSVKSTATTRFFEWRRDVSPRPDLLLLDAQFAGVGDYLQLVDRAGRLPALWVGSPSTDQFRLRTGSILRRPIQWSKLPEMLTNILQQRMRNTQPMPVMHAASQVMQGLIASAETGRGHAWGALLGPHAMEYVLVPSAEAAVASARAKPFALVLLDTLTPGIDPFKACHLLKTGVAEKMNGRDPAVVLLVERVTRDARKMGELVFADAVVERDAPQVFIADLLAKLVTK